MIAASLRTSTASYAKAHGSVQTFPSKRPGPETTFTRFRQAAKRLIRAVGRGFIPGIKTMESAVALATEVCFCGESPEIMPFPQPLQSCRKPNKKRPGFSPRGMLFGPFVQNQPFSAACLSRSEGIEHRLPVIRRLSEIEHRKSENGHFRLLPSTIVDAK